MKLPFEWSQPSKIKDEVGLEIQTIERVVTLVASAMIAVLRGPEHTQEVADER